MANGREPAQSPVTVVARRVPENPARELKAMPVPNRSPAAGGDLPYFKEYLRHVLRPRVETIIHALNERLSEVAWRELLEAVSRDQSGPVPVDAASLRALLEEQLGLQLDAQLRGVFAEAALPEPRSVNGVEVVEDAAAAKRRAMTSNPLANAVLDNRTRY